MPNRSDTNAIGGYGALIAAGSVAIVVLVVLIVVIVSSGGDDDRRQRTATSQGKQPRAVLQAFLIGVRVRKPSGWTARRGDRSVSLRSPDRTVALSISLPPGARRNAAVLAEDLAAIRRSYNNVRMSRRSGRRLANLPTVSVVSSATNRRGVKLRILSASPQGRRRAWLIQVFAAESAPRGRLAQAQTVIGTLHLAG